MSQNSAVKPRVEKLITAFGISVWVLLGLFGFTTAVFTVLFWILPMELSRYLIGSSAGQFSLIALQYIITLTVVVGLPLLILHFARQEGGNLRKLLGVYNPPKALYLLIIPLVWVVYLITSNTIVEIVTRLIPGFDVNQAQDIGFNNISQLGEYVLAFVALVVLAPLAEELLFRGYLFGKLRELGGFWPSAILTSIIFGIAHQQWNVGIDVFVLSLFLCALREKSGSIWASVGLHAFKNAIAYFLLFIGPLIGINLQ